LVLVKSFSKVSCTLSIKIVKKLDFKAFVIFIFIGLC